MKIHDSQYENEGWINLDKTKPEPKKKVKFAQINIMDWNLENMNWQTEGWMLESETISLKLRDGMTTKSGSPTHWKEI